jgi:hypothetical protein
MAPDGVVAPVNHHTYDIAFQMPASTDREQTHEPKHRPKSAAGQNAEKRDAETPKAKTTANEKRRAKDEKQTDDHEQNPKRH